MLIDIQFIVPPHSSPGNGSQGSTHKAAQVVDRRCSLDAGYQTVDHSMCRLYGVPCSLQVKVSKRENVLHSIYRRIYSQACIKRSPLGHRKGGLIKQVTSAMRFNSYEICRYLLIQV
jgi:hypothetical protein